MQIRREELFKLGVRIANEAIEALSPDEIRDMHTCVCYMRMAELFKNEKVTECILFDELKDKLHKAISKLIVTDISKRNGYVCRPSCFINSKESEYWLSNKELADYEYEHL